MTRPLRILFLLICFACFALPSQASHIVGGEITYKYDSLDWYTVTVAIYEDCLNGDPQAIAQDNPAYISIFQGNGVPASGFLGGGNPGPGDGGFDTIEAPSSASVLVPTNFSNNCINNAPATCLRKLSFVKHYYLPENSEGYTIVYQRCCRNGAIINIVDPSSVGATYTCTVPPLSQAVHNNSAVFKNYPPQIICVNNPLVYDNSATDPDGDSLSYEFCQAYVGGSDGDAKPVPPPPPYGLVTYVYPFTYLNPMGGDPQIQIDPVTGLITGTPNLKGRFVVGVCCHEWRNHQVINTVTREFQFVVTDCSKAVVADIPQYSNEVNTYIVDCTNYTVNFVNTSQGGFSYHWDFGVPNDPADTSSEFQPTFTYPDTGVYVVKLVVNPHTTCTDSINRFVKVFPTFHAVYGYNGLQCPGSPIMFTDSTTSTYKPIVDWIWNYGDGNVFQTTDSTQDNPTHIYNQGGTYNVTLYAQNDKGCQDTFLRQIVIDDFTPFAGDDTVIVKGQSIDFDATGGIQYTWSPPYFLNDTSVYNPVGYYPDTGHFAYNVHVVSPFGCVGNDSVKVWVVGQPSVFIPSAFTPNGDGKDDLFRPLSVGYGSVKYFNVFDRYGVLVYSTKTLESGWDGTYHGRKEDVGTYYWELDIINSAGKEDKLKGDVTLLR